MKLTRDKIQRMVGSQSSMGSGSGGGGSIGITEQRVMEILQDYETVEDLETTLQGYVTNTTLETTLASYATQQWVDQNYLSISFFRALFQARTSGGSEVVPNSGNTSTIDNIKAMFGFWTDQYISALGQGSDGGGPVTTLAQLNDVELNLPLVDGDILSYSTTLGKWTNGAAISMAWANITGKPTTIAGYGITDAYISNGTITLGADSLTPITSLAGYATESWVNTQLASYVTTSALTTTLADYATTTWVSNTLSAFASQQWVDQNYLSLSFFNALFQARTSQGATVSPNSGDTTTIDNIKALFGFWTDQYISALGQGSDGGGGQGDVTWALLADDTDTRQIALSHLTTALTGYATTSQLSSYLPLSGGTLSGNLLVSADKGANIGSASARFYYNYLYRILGLASISASTDGTNVLTLPSKTGTLAVVGDIPTNNNQLSNGAGYITGITSSMVTTALGYTPANSTELSNYLPLSGGIVTGLTEFCDAIVIWDSTSKNYDATLTWRSGYFNIYCFENIYHDICIGTSSGDFGSLYFDATNYYWGINTSSPSYRLHVNGDAYADSFIKKNGTSSQFLKADGSVDSNTYALSSSLSNYLPLSGGTLSGGLAISAAGRQLLMLDSIPSSSGSWVGIQMMGNGVFWGGIRMDAKDGYLYRYKSDYSTYTIIDSSNIGSQSVSYATSAGSATDSTKLPLAGGTMTGYIDFNLSNGIITRHIPSGSTLPALGTMNNTVMLAANATHIWGAFMWLTGNGNTHLQCGRNDGDTSTYSLCIQELGGNVGIGTASPSCTLDVKGEINSHYIEFYKNDLITKSGYVGRGSSLNDDLYIEASTGQNLRLGANSSTAMIINSSHFVEFYSGIGIWDSDSKNYDGVLTWRSGYFNIYCYENGYHDICIGTTSGSNGSLYFKASNNCWGINTSSPSYRLHVAGDIYATGGVTSLSDIRKKDVLSYELPLSVEQIANAPTIKFLWKDKREEGEQVGTIAQYWEKVLPESIKDKSGELSMSYGVAALVSAITTARKVVDHDRLLREQAAKISELENKCSFLEREVERLKCA